jgi:hypothetical protein
MQTGVYLALLAAVTVYLQSYIPRPINTVEGGQATVPFHLWPSPAQFSFMFRLDSLAQLQQLVPLLRLPAVVRKHGYVAQNIDALAVTLSRLAFPKRIGDLRHLLRLSWTAGKISSIVSATVESLMETWGELLEYDRRVFTNADRLRQFGAAVHAVGCPFVYFPAFIDGTVFHIARPGGDPLVQNGQFNGHYRSHCIRWQGVTTPDGMIAAFYGPVQGMGLASGGHAWRLACCSCAVYYLLPLNIPLRLTHPGG